MALSTLFNLSSLSSSSSQAVVPTQAAAPSGKEEKATVYAPMSNLIKATLRGMRVGSRMKIGGSSFHFHRKQAGMLVYRCTLSVDTGNLTTTAGGAISNGYSTQLSGSFGDWTGLAAIFDLYKPLSGVIHFEPYYKYQSSTGPANFKTTTCLIVYDPDNTGASQTYASMLAYDYDAPTNPLRLHNLADSWKYPYVIPKDPQYGPSGAVAEGLWLNTGAPISTGIVYLTATTNQAQGATQNIGMIFHTINVEFALRQ